MEKFAVYSGRAEDESNSDPLGSSRPCSPDTSPEAERLELLYQILRLPTVQFQALCCGIRNNMTAEEIAKMFASWTEDRVRNNIFETMVELEEKTTILSSSYQQRVQQYKVETTKEVPEVQLAPVTKEVFVTVLDSLQGSLTDVTKAASKQQFVSHLNKMVNKIKTFPKRLRPSPKASKELSITPEVCKTLSDLLALPDPEGSTKSAQSITSVHSSQDRLYAEDNLNRASENVQNILFTSAAPSSSQEGITVALQSNASSLSVSSIKSVHDDARGIVDTIVTDLEELYESMEPMEIEMLQNQNIQSQKLAEPEIDDTQNTPQEILQSQEKEKAEPTKKFHATEKLFNNKLCNVLCRAQIKVRMFFTLHGSQDICCRKTTETHCQDDASLEEPCREDADLKELCREDADLEEPCREDANLEASSEQSIADTNLVTSFDEAQQGSEEAETPAVKALTSHDVSSSLVSSLPETDGSDYDAVILSSQSPLQQSMASSSQTDLQDDHFTLQDEARQDELGDNIEAEASPGSEASLVPETVAAVTTDHKKRSLGKTFKNIFAKQPKGSTDAPAVHVDTQEVVSMAVPRGEGTETLSLGSNRQESSSQTCLQGEQIVSDGEECTAECAELGDSVTETIAETGQASQSSPAPEEATTTAVSDGKRNSLGKTFKKLFAKQPTSLHDAPNIPVDTQRADELLASNGGAFSGDTDTITDSTRASQPSPTPATVIPDENKPRFGKKMKIFSAEKPKSMRNAPLTQEMTSVVEAEEVPETVSHTLDTAVQQCMTSETFQTCPGDEQLASTDGEEFQEGRAEISDGVIETIAETTQASQSSPPAVVASDKNKHSIGGKFKSLFAKQPKSVAPPVTPVDNQESPSVVQKGDSPDTISLASEAVVRQSIALAYESVCKDDGFVTSDDADRKYECTEPGDSVIELVVDTANVSQAPPVSETPVAAAADGSKPGLGRKLKNLFAKPKILTERPTAQSDTLDMVSSIVETEDGGSGPDVALLASETPLQQSMALSSQTCLQDDHMTVASDGGEVNTECGDLSKTDMTVEESQVPPISEQPAAMVVAAEGGNKRSFGKTFKTLFARQPRNVSEGPKVPTDVQEQVLSPLEEAAMPSGESSTPEAGLSASEASVGQTMSTSLDQSLDQSVTDAPTEEPAPLREDINVCDDSAKASISPGPLSDTTSGNKKHGRLQIGARLKNVFNKQSKPAQAIQVTPADTHEVVPTEKDTLKTSAGHLSSSSPPMAVVPEFSNAAEATAAIKDVMERVRNGLDDVDTATAKIEFLMAHGVLQPFIKALVDKVFDHMRTTSSSPANGAPRKSSSDPNTQMTERHGEQKRELILDPDSELAYAFARRAVKGLLVYLLGMFVPLLEEAGMEFVHEIMAKKVVSEISVHSVDNGVKGSVNE